MREIPNTERLSLLVEKINEDIGGLEDLLAERDDIREILEDEFWPDIEDEWAKTNPSDEELSARFDEVLDRIPYVDCLADGPAIREAFNDWTDGLCRDGEISQHTYDTCRYVGKYAKDADQ